MIPTGSSNISQTRLANGAANPPLVRRYDRDQVSSNQQTSTVHLGGLAMIASCCYRGFPLGVSRFVRFGQTSGRVQREFGLLAGAYPHIVVEVKVGRG
jgi:hypothetical protein